MRVRAAALVCLLLAAVALAGCGTESGTATPTGLAPSSDAPILMDKAPVNPPDIVVHSADGAGEVTLPRSGGCWTGDEGGSCVDGVAGPDRPELRVLTGAGPATFDFPLAGWTFAAAFTDFPDDPHAKHSHAVEVQQPVPGRFVIIPLRASGDFEVALTGSGPQGDIQGVFRWQVAASGELPEVVEWDSKGFAPPVTLDLDGRRVDLAAWTACYGNGCWDGAARPPYVDVGTRDAVPFSFPDPGWTFEATFRSGEFTDCPRVVTVPVRRTSDGTFEVTAAGPAGTWVVDLFGRGPDGGDVITTFAWTTTTDGTLPEAATGSAGVLADLDPGLTSYGVEVYVQDLASRPRHATATVTVTSAAGRSVTLTPRWEKECFTRGSLTFTAPDSEGLRATDLGPGPFTYDVALTMDGTTYHGVGTWPDGETEDIAPHVALTWTPELPAYEG